MKKWFILIVVVLAAGGGYWYWKKSRTAAATPTTPTVTYQKAIRDTLRQTVSSTGKVTSNLDVEIKCKASGQIITLPYDISTSVTQGTLLAALDPVDELRNVRQAEVETSSSQARVSQARINYEVAKLALEQDRRRAIANRASAQVNAREARAKADRVKSLFERQLASSEEAESAEATAVSAQSSLESAIIAVEQIRNSELSLENRANDVRLAEAALETDRIALSNAQQRLRDTKVYAPISGIIASRPVQVGNIVASGVSNVGGGTTIMTISDLSRVFVLGSIDESDIGKIQLGQPVNIRVDAYPDRRFRGRVTRIATTGVATSNVVTFEVKIEVLSRDKSLLKPVMTANLEIVAAESEDTIIIPADAISRNKEGKRIVKVKVAEGKTEEREVELGISNGAQTEIVDGIAEGEEVEVKAGGAESRWRNAAANRQQGNRTPGMGMMMMGGGRR